MIFLPCRRTAIHTTKETQNAQAFCVSFCIFHVPPENTSSRPVAGSLLLCGYAAPLQETYISLMAACAAANVLRAMFKIIPKCRSGVPGRQVSQLCRSQLLPHHHQGITQQVLPLPFRAVKSVRVVHGQTDAPYPIFHRTFGKNSVSCFFQLFP